MKIRPIAHCLSGLAAVFSLTGCFSTTMDVIETHGADHHNPHYGHGQGHDGHGHGQGGRYWDPHNQRWVYPDPGPPHGHGAGTGGGSPMYHQPNSYTPYYPNAPYQRYSPRRY